MGNRSLHASQTGAVCVGRAWSSVDGVGSLWLPSRLLAWQCLPHGDPGNEQQLKRLGPVAVFPLST